MDDERGSFMPVHVTSEIGPLKRVMLHRPGKELEQLRPMLAEMRDAFHTAEKNSAGQRGSGTL